MYIMTKEKKISRRNTWSIVTNSSQRSERMRTEGKTLKFNHLKVPGTATYLSV